MRPIALTIAPSASDDNAIAESQTPAAGGVQALTLTASSITISPPTHVLVTCAGSDAARTFTVTGVDRHGAALTEAIAGSDGGTTAGASNFAAVTGVTVDDDTAGAVEVGTADSLDSPWVIVDSRNCDSNVGFSVDLSSGADFTYTVQYTVDNVFDVGESAATAYPHASIATKTASQSGFFSGQPVFAVRVTVSSYVAGSAVFNVLSPSGS